MNLRGALKLAVRLLKVPLFALFGAWTALRAGFGLGRRLSGAARLLQDALSCPSCHASNPLHGRWKCRSCGATYHGFVGECPLCRSGASFFACHRCGISIFLVRQLP